MTSAGEEVIDPRRSVEGNFPQENKDTTMTHPFLSQTALSNLFTMKAASKKDFRQSIPQSAGIPNNDVRLLRAQLILEEARETLHALGFDVGFDRNENPCIEKWGPAEPLEAIIDGCCDLCYVTVGTLLACGVPDLPHLHLVNKANNAKFPDGEPIINPKTGKYLKPDGWQSPNHMKLLDTFKIDLPSIAERLTGNADE